jgi:hypothetical protein
MKDLMVFPPRDGECLVTGKLRVRRAGSPVYYSPFLLYTPVPFRADGGLQDKEYSSVRDYLDSIVSRNNGLHYRYAYWREAAYITGACIVGNLVLVGIVAPWCLRGLAKPRVVFHSVAQKEPPSHEPVPAFNSPPPAPAGSDNTENPSETTALSSTQTSQKKYAGEYYPVEKSSEPDRTSQV